MHLTNPHLHNSRYTCKTYYLFSLLSMQSCTCGFIGFLNTGGSAAELKLLQNLHHADFFK